MLCPYRGLEAWVGDRPAVEIVGAQHAGVSVEVIILMFVAIDWTHRIPFGIFSFRRAQPL